MKDRNQPRCANCRYFCQEIDPENRAYFDDRSGECRRRPPHNNFAWCRTRLYHWCGDWEAQTAQAPGWQRVTSHPKNDRPVLLYRKGAFCKQSGMFVGYWNPAFGKWHDDGDRLLEYNEFTHWSNLPEPPES